MKFSRQTTLRTHVTMMGVGVHSGAPVNLVLGPAPVDTGFIFVRSDTNREIRASHSAVTATELQTVLGDKTGPIVSTAEHVLAALRGMGVDNATIEVDGPEIPIMDGSSGPFVAAIEAAGVVQQSAPRRFIEVLKPIKVAFGSSVGELRPYAGGFRAEIEINFSNPQIGRQAYNFDLTPETFRRDISRARTFGCMKDVSRLLSAGFARGASFDNSVVFDDDRLLNTEGLRYSDECVRHKVLDAVGDLALAGLPLLGLYRSVRGGHKLNHAVLSTLMNDRHAWRVVEAEPVAARRRATVADTVGTMLGGGIVAPAFAPDVS